MMRLSWTLAANCNAFSTEFISCTGLVQKTLRKVNDRTLMVVAMDGRCIRRCGKRCRWLFQVTDVRFHVDPKTLASGLSTTWLISSLRKGLLGKDLDSLSRLKLVLLTVGSCWKHSPSIAAEGPIPEASGKVIPVGIVMNAVEGSSTTINLSKWDFILHTKQAAHVILVMRWKLNCGIYQSLFSLPHYGPGYLTDLVQWGGGKQLWFVGPQSGSSVLWGPKMARRAMLSTTVSGRSIVTLKLVIWGENTYWTNSPIQDELCGISWGWFVWINIKQASKRERGDVLEIVVLSIVVIESLPNTYRIYEK